MVRGRRRASVQDNQRQRRGCPALSSPERLTPFGAAQGWLGGRTARTRVRPALPTRETRVRQDLCLAAAAALLLWRAQILPDIFSAGNPQSHAVSPSPLPPCCVPLGAFPLISYSHHGTACTFWNGRPDCVSRSSARETDAEHAPLESYILAKSCLWRTKTLVRNVSCCEQTFYNYLFRVRIGALRTDLVVHQGPTAVPLLHDSVGTEARSPGRPPHTSNGNQIQSQIKCRPLVKMVNFFFLTSGVHLTS